MNPIEKILADYPFVILDGGLATELEKRGFNLKGKLWSARLLDSDPGSIRDVHLSYLEAGADCIITSSYQATLQGYMSEGYSLRDAEKLIARSVSIANEAVESFLDGARELNGRPLPLVAASAGCYGAYLADGSEYRGDYHLDSGGYKKFHRERVEILAAAGANIIAFETFPSLEEADAVSELMSEYSDLYYWIVFTLRDPLTISNGDSLGECVRHLQGKKNLVGTGINCSSPGFVTPAIEKISTLTSNRIIAYPNSGEHFYIDCSCWEDDPSVADFYSLSEEWFNSGARLIGGCCRTGPSEIGRIKQFRNKLEAEK